MKKYVDIIPKLPVQLGSHVQRVRSNRVWLDTEDIRKALIAKATVIEHTVFGDVSLGLNNYDIDLNNITEINKLEKEIEPPKGSDEFASSEKAVHPENIENIDYDGVSEILKYNDEDLVTVVEDIES